MSHKPQTGSIFINAEEFRRVLRPVVSKIRLEEHGFGLTILDASDVDIEDYKKLVKFYETLDKE